MNFKKLLKTGALFALITGITVTYVSKDTEIKAGIDNLKAKVIEQFNGKKQAQAQLEEAQGKLSSILEALGLDSSATQEEILSAINSSKEANLTTIAEALGLDSSATQEEIIAEINSLNNEVTRLEEQGDTLTAKINQLVADLEQANSEEVEQLAYVNSAIEEVEQAVAEEQPPAEVPPTDEEVSTETEQQIAQLIKGTNPISISTDGQKIILRYNSAGNLSDGRNEIASNEVGANYNYNAVATTLTLTPKDTGINFDLVAQLVNQ